MSAIPTSFDFDVGTELERLKGQVPWDAPDSSYLGMHGRTEPDQNGYIHFRVYQLANFFVWTACTTDEESRGFRYGPYKTARDAYLAGEVGEE
jgi:hypothetical protein